MSYVDVETSAEALQEDEELIEAVNEIVEAAAVAVYTDIKNDVSGVLFRIRFFLENAFPFLIDWREDPAAFPKAMRSLALSFILYLIAFWILGASRRWRTDQRQKKRFPAILTSDKRNSSLKLLRRKLAATFNKKPQGSLSKRRPTIERSKSASSIAGLRWGSNLSFFGKRRDEADGEDDDDDEEEEETEDEKFAKRWRTISQTKYGCLVLPPECKRVEKSKIPPGSDSKRVSSVSAAHVQDLPATESDDENPYQRLVNYCRHFLHLMVNFLKFDYVGAGYSLYRWVEWWARNRRNRQLGTPPQHPGGDDHSDAEDSGIVRKLSFDSNDVPAVNSDSKPETVVNLRSPKGKMRRKRDIVASSVEFDTQLSEKSTTDALDIPPKADLLARSIIEAEEKKDGSGPYNNDGEFSSCSSLETPPPTPTSLHRMDYTKHPDSIYCTPAGLGSQSQLGLSDGVVSKLALSVRSSGSVTQAQSVLPKPKDALENYRKPILQARSTRDLARDSPPTLPEIPTSLSLDHQRFDSCGEYSSTSSTAETTAIDSAPNIHSRGKDGIQRSSTSSAYYFETASSQDMLQRMSVEVPVPDRNGYIVGDEFLPDAQNWKPLLVFVNSRSGPQQGQFLIAQLRGLLNPIQVWDLANGGPEEILESFTTKFSRLRILVCGGDGTVSWIVSTIDNMRLQRKPPIAILPLGTGNDLARIHGWGGGYSNEPLTAILEQVADSYISWLDRWEMSIENKRGKVHEVKSFFNYLGVGADAQAALQVHLLRESRPQLFFSRVVNKAWYGIFGAEDILKATSINLPHEITLFADGVEIPLPDDSQGIILLNIDSYAGGVPLWSLGSKGDSLVNSPSSSRSNSWTESRMKRSHSLDMIKEMKASKEAELASRTKESGQNASFERADSVEDLGALSNEEKYRRVTSCERPSSCQDGLLDVVSIRGAFHLGQIRVGLSNAQKICQCREATIMIKRKVSVQIDGEPWRQEVCTLRIKRKKDAAIMLHRSAVDSNGVETEMANLLDWAEDRKMIDERVHAALMKEFSRRIESKTRQRREQHHRQSGFSLKRAIASSGNMGGGGGPSAGIVF